MRYIALIAVTAVCFWLAQGERNDTLSDYARELAQIENDIALTESEPYEQSRALKLVYLHYLRASLTGSFEHYHSTETVIAHAIDAFGALPTLVLSRANLHFKLHRLEATKRDIEALAQYSTHPPVIALQADVYLQEGDYSRAFDLYQRLARDHPTWDALARLAHYRFNTLRPDIAERLYDDARQVMSVKEKRHYAWLELRKGIADLRHGRYQQALAHYLQAQSEYSGYWLIEEHIAEVLHLLGRSVEAVALYEKIIDETNKPELVSALADILDEGNSERGHVLRAQADRQFDRQLASYPEASIGHITQSLLSRQHPGPDLLRFAKRNHELRPNAESKLLLARSYLKLNAFAEAKNLLDQIRKTPWRPPELRQLALRLESPANPLASYEPVSADAR